VKAARHNTASATPRWARDVVGISQPMTHA
jgi:hypothetical protein